MDALFTDSSPHVLRRRQGVIGINLVLFVIAAEVGWLVGWERVKTWRSWVVSAPSFLSAPAPLIITPRFGSEHLPRPEADCELIGKARGGATDRVR